MNTLIFCDTEVSKNEFYGNKETVSLNLIDINKIVVSNKIKGNNERSKYFIGHMDNIGETTPLCTVLPQMTGYIKYFENGVTNLSFKIDDHSAYIKYNQIWNKIKELLGVKLYSEPIYDDSYIKTKVKTFSGIIKTLFSGDEIPKERLECFYCRYFC